MQRSIAVLELLENRRLLASVAGDLSTPTKRVEVNLNSDWRFIKQDVPAATARIFDASSWQKVSVPHTYNAFDGQDGGNNYFRGKTTYRRTWRIPENLVGFQYYLRFEGVGHTAEVWVNGSKAGLHEGSYGAFVYDLNPFIKAGITNSFTVKVSNAKNDNLAPSEDDWNLYGGIYRDVKVIAVDTAHINPTDYGSSGVYLAQNDVNKNSARIDAKTLIRSTSSKDRRFDVITTVFDASGNAVAEAVTRQKLPRKTAANLTQNITVSKPKLWDGTRNPYLYTVRTMLRNTEGAVLDSVTHKVGLRSFTVDVNNGLILNGSRYELRGVALHQDRLNKGNAISDNDRKQDIDLVREMGSTGVRLAHYQHDQYTYDLADQKGLVVWAEIPVYGSMTNTPEFRASARQQLLEMIRQNFNHPSILFWAMGNELNDNTPSVNLLGDLHTLARGEDPGRYTTYASNYTDRPINYVTQLTGLNRYDGWYAGLVEQFGGALSELHTRKPNVAIGLSEYGVGGNINTHVNDPNPPKPADTETPFHPEQYLNVFHEKAWAQIAGKKWLWSKFVWSLADFASDLRHEGDKNGRVDKGMVTYDRNTKKDVFYFYKANWTTSPVLYLTSRRYTERTDPTTEVKVYSNHDSVELRVNGVLIGGAANATKTFSTFKWADVALTPGDNTIQVKATKNGQTYTDTVTWTYTPQTPRTPLAAVANPPTRPFQASKAIDDDRLVLLV